MILSWKKFINLYVYVIFCNFLKFKRFIIFIIIKKYGIIGFINMERLIYVYIIICIDILLKIYWY